MGARCGNGIGYQIIKLIVYFVGCKVSFNGFDTVNGLAAKYIRSRGRVQSLLVGSQPTEGTCEL